MADVSKAHKLKLANSRKRFKELQELKKLKDANTSTNITDTNIKDPDSLTSSTHSSINTEVTLEHTNVVNTQLPNYFTNTDYTVDNSMFFDNFPHKENENNVFNIQNNEVFLAKEQILNQDGQHMKETQQSDGSNIDSVAIEDPELKPNELFEHHKNAENLFSERNRQNLIEYLQQETQVGTAEKDILQNSTKVVDNLTNSNIDSIPYYSNQIPSVSESYNNDSNSITDLEKRSIELVSSLEQEKALSQQQKNTIHELQSRILELENENKLCSNNILEINKLGEELQCHAQTIRLLVAEKSELSNSLSLIELNFKNKNSECDELQARLKASRSRAFELEQELNSLKSERVHKESNGHDQNKIIENLKRDCDSLQENKEELNQDLLETREKLKSAIEEVSNLQSLNSELSGKLSLADIKIQQLIGADHQTVNVQVEKLLEEKTELAKEVMALNTMVKNITKERDESTNHYQHYTEELNSQVLTLQEQYQKLQQENENLCIQEQNRVKHIGDLERQLQNIQNERVVFSSSNLVDSNVKNELDVTRELCVQLQVGHPILYRKY